MANLRKLGRRTDHRATMLKNLVQSLFENGRIKTAVTRAKEARGEAEKMTTLDKKDDLNTRREALKYMYKKDVVYILFKEITPVHADGQGRYTRILRLEPRRGNGTEMCMPELVSYTKKESSEEKETVGANK